MLVLSRCLVWKWRVSGLIRVLGLVPFLFGPAPLAKAEVPVNVLDVPATQGSYDEAVLRLELAFREGNYGQVGEWLVRLEEFTSTDPLIDFQRARLMAAMGQKERALEALDLSTEKGFRDASRIAREKLFEAYREDEAFLQFLKRSGSEARFVPPLPEGVEVSPVALTAEVTPAQLYWDYSSGVFRSTFQWEERQSFPSFDQTDEPVSALFGKWKKRGRLAGNQGDVYDNYDLGHSGLSQERFPGLSRITYGPALQEKGLAHGLQLRFLHDAVVVGNSSMAATENAFWRSQPRLAYANRGMADKLHEQYRNNHLYVYPEHRDYDPGHNGALEGGHGDVYPAITPYLLISQGSSYSDQAFVEAVFLTLAAFQPEVKERLIAHGMLMPTVQKIFRWCYGGSNEESYLSGASHPSAFDGSKIQLEKMVRMAQEMSLETLPPLVKLRVLAEDKDSLFGDDRLMDTPQAVARVFRSPRYIRAMIVSATESFDLQDEALSFKWVILRGDESRVRVRPLNENGSVAEVVVAWHERFPISEGSEMETNRVDIGVFADNGKSLSAPAFISTYFLDNEKRLYGQTKRLLTLDYSDPGKKDNYVDPMIEPHKGWRDDFTYDAEGNMTGWKRTHDGLIQRFTAQGRLITEIDGKGRAIRTKAVKYTLSQDPDNATRPRVIMTVE